MSNLYEETLVHTVKKYKALQVRMGLANDRIKVLETKNTTLTRKLKKLKLEGV